MADGGSVPLQSTDDPLALAREYLLAVRRDEPVDGVERRLAGVYPDRLVAALDDDAARRAFWINVYNAAVQARLREDHRRFAGPRRWLFFVRPVVTVAGHDLSPNAIEHGILRRSALSVGLGYVSNPLPDGFERVHRVDDLDPRVHFALNCGAAACPPIAVYEADVVDEQLDAATRSYLDATVEYDADAERATVSRLFRWYRGDFGGADGIRAFLRTHDAVPEDAEGFALSYADYDWSLDLGAFRD